MTTIKWNDKEYRDEMKYTNATIVGLIKGSK